MGNSSNNGIQQRGEKEGAHGTIWNVWTPSTSYDFPHTFLPQLVFRKEKFEFFKFFFLGSKLESVMRINQESDTSLYKAFLSIAII